MGAKREAQKVAMAVRHRQHAEKIKECQCSGMSVKAWCQQEGITPTTYYRWQREIRRDFLASAEGQEMAAQLLPVAAQSTKMLPGSRFSEVPTLSLEAAAVPCAEPAIRVQIGKAIIEIQKETDARLAESVVRALAKLC